MIIFRLNVLIFMSLSAFVYSCANPFSSRPVEEPDGIAADLVFPGSADEWVATFADAHMDANLQQYTRLFQDSLASDFQFQFVPEITQQGILSQWSQEDEFLHFQNFTSAVSQIDLSFSNREEDNFVDSIFIDVSYRLRYISEQRREEYNGDSLFKLKFVNSYYVLYYWQDFSSTATRGDSTWSLLKSKY
jgi:hypothetical protein